MGALILFASVQVTMLAIGLLSGERLYAVEWLGAAVAFAGFVYLVLPGASAPSLVGLGLMIVAGVAWGFYTLAGKGASNPLRDTAYNFACTLPFAIGLLVLSVDQSQMQAEGVLLAIISDSLTSGVGYAVWYAALKGLSTIQAAVWQLLVPALATVGGIWVSDEVLSLRLVIASLLILGGILTLIVGKQYIERRRASKLIF